MPESTLTATHRRTLGRSMRSSHEERSKAKTEKSMDSLIIVCAHIDTSDPRLTIRIPAKRALRIAVRPIEAAQVNARQLHANADRRNWNRTMAPGLLFRTLNIRGTSGGLSPSHSLWLLSGAAAVRI
jgi:hypothetical protein